MSGHSKWSTIKRKKGAQDAKRGKIFTQLIREIAMAARLGGGDASGNPRLRIAIEKARGQNMPKENIERAIKRGTGAGDGDSYEEIRYEGYGPAGVAVIVDTLTDNRNRTVGEVRHAFEKYGGNLGSSGCVAFLFDLTGILVLDSAAVDADRLTEVAIEANAQDVVEDAGTIEVHTDPEDFEAVKAALAGQFEVVTAELRMLPQSSVTLTGKSAVSMLKLMEVLDEHDDVKQVHANFDISAEEMIEIAAA